MSSSMVAMPNEGARLGELPMLEAEAEARGGVTRLLSDLREYSSGMSTLSLPKSTEMRLDRVERRDEEAVSEDPRDGKISKSSREGLARGSRHSGTSAELHSVEMLPALDPARDMPASTAWLSAIEILDMVVFVVMISGSRFSGEVQGDAQRVNIRQLIRLMGVRDLSNRSGSTMDREGLV